MQSRDRIAELVAALTNQTKADRVNWEVVDEGGQQFQYSTPSSSVLIRTKDGDGVAPYVIEIYDNHGDMVESVRTTVEDRDDPWSSGSFNAAVEELFTLARRNALNIDGVLDDLLESLKEEPPF